MNQMIDISNFYEDLSHMNNFHTLYCCSIDIEELNKLDKDTIIKNLVAWLEEKQYNESYEKIRGQMFLASLPDIENLIDLLEYSAQFYFKEITGFIDYLITCN